MIKRVTTGLRPATVTDPILLPRNGAAHSGLNPPTLIISQDNLLWTIPQ
ncbi:mCG1045326 [Mus musculus]|nr:mCG1045326 [Mus musculus]